MNKSVITLALAALVATAGQAQQTQKLTATKLNDYGLIYTLPTTHLAVDVKAVKTVRKAGPFYKYAKKYLGVDKVIIADSQTWDIESITVTPFGVADKENEFLMTFKAGAAPFVIVDREGMPLAINKEVTVEEPSKSADAPKATGDNQADAVNVFSEDMVAGESTMKRAEAAASKIFELRETRNDLVSGNADKMPPDGASLKLMLDELNRQERILTAMFVGTTTTETVVAQFDYLPADAVSREVIFRVSDYDGIVDRNDLGGDPVYLTLTVDSRGELPVDEKGEVKRVPKDAVMYCIPGKATVSISYKGKQYAKRSVQVSQFGVQFGLNPKAFVDKKAPAYVEFYPETGAIKDYGVTTPEEPQQ
ncbi:MAG: DUF4831 family protein [Candidatus Limisoma sp.]